MKVTPLEEIRSLEHAAEVVAAIAADCREEAKANLPTESDDGDPELLAMLVYDANTLRRFSVALTDGDDHEITACAKGVPKATWIKIPRRVESFLKGMGLLERIGQ